MKTKRSRTKKKRLFLVKSLLAAYNIIDKKDWTFK